MKSDIITVSSKGSHMETALRQAEKVAVYKELPDKAGLHLRLLTEEMMGLMRSIAGDLKGEFWIEDKDQVYELHLRVETQMNEYQRDQLISVSSEGKNEATRGFMGKLRAFFMPSSDKPVYMGLMFPDSAPMMYSTMSWSMEEYRRQLEQYREENKEGAQEAWDELEKSVVAHVADDVKVSIKGRIAEMTIFKKM